VRPRITTSVGLTHSASHVDRSRPSSLHSSRARLERSRRLRHSPGTLECPRCSSDGHSFQWGHEGTALRAGHEILGSWLVATALPRRSPACGCRRGGSLMWPSARGHARMLGRGRSSVFAPPRDGSSFITGDKMRFPRCLARAPIHACLSRSWDGQRGRTHLLPPHELGVSSARLPVFASSVRASVANTAGATMLGEWDKGVRTPAVEVMLPRKAGARGCRSGALRSHLPSLGRCSSKLSRPIPSG